MFRIHHAKIDSHEDDIFNCRSQLICSGGAELLIAFVGKGENDIKINAIDTNINMDIFILQLHCHPRHHNRPS